MAKISDQVVNTLLVSDPYKVSGIRGNGVALIIAALVLFGLGAFSGVKVYSWYIGDYWKDHYEAQVLVQKESHERERKLLKDQTEILLSQLEEQRKEKVDATARANNRQRALNDLKAQMEDLKSCLPLEVPNETFR